MVKSLREVVSNSKIVCAVGGGVGVVACTQLHGRMMTTMISWLCDFLRLPWLCRCFSVQVNA